MVLPSRSHLENVGQRIERDGPAAELIRQEYVSV